MMLLTRFGSFSAFLGGLFSGRLWFVTVHYSYSVRGTSLQTGGGGKGEVVVRSCVCV